MQIKLNDENHELTVKQQINYKNDSGIDLDTLYFYDWNHAYSDKKSPLAKRFSDEFSIYFHVAKDEDRGETKNIQIMDAVSKTKLAFTRKENQIDIIALPLDKRLKSGENRTFIVNYEVKLPDVRFTKFGFSPDGSYNLKDCWILPVRFDKGFKTYSNLNLDDAEVALTDYDVQLEIPKKYRCYSDLIENERLENDTTTTFYLKAQNKKNFHIWLDTKPSFQRFMDAENEIVNGLKSKTLNDLQVALVIDRVRKFSSQYLGDSPPKKLLITQAEYDRNPVYGLNQLPSFLSPFNDDFIFEIQFLKTYLQVYLKETLPIDLRNEQWILDGIQIFIMMEYVDFFHPEQQMMGKIGRIGLLKSYKLTQVNFNEQYQYFYDLMLRKNLDQALDLPKDELIKFNEQIANKYKSGLNFKYLNAFLGDSILPKSIKKFIAKPLQNQNTRTDFIQVVENESGKNLGWFTKQLVTSREAMDYQWLKTNSTKDSASFKIITKHTNPIPVPIYTFKDKKLVNKYWLENPKKDTVFTFSKDDVDKIVINYEQLLPEYHKRNNFRSLKKPFNRPFKFNVIRDLEDANYNQVLFTPSISYNLYDGISPGLRLHNKAILDKPFNFDVTPIYSSITQSLIGNMNLVFNDYRRESRLFHIRYSLSASYYHYAPDAVYSRINPTALFRFRKDQFRDNHRKLLYVRSVNIYREASPFADDVTDNYSILNMRFINSHTEMTRHFSYAPDVQFSNLFGKISGEVEFRKLFNNNRQFNVRWYGGLFLYRNTDSEFFDFGLDRPTDYMFDLPLLGRSETTGLFSQQFIMAEGGFKSKLPNRFANQFLTTLNTSTSIWNWIEAYADVGLLKSNNQNMEFVYDSGIRLNLVTDYFELYFPVYSSNGWEVGQTNYNERIRFVVTLNPRILTTLFTRKWF